MRGFFLNLNVSIIIRSRYMRNNIHNHEQQDKFMYASFKGKSKV